jgi:long-chain acyl-CoA synthetase
MKAAFVENPRMARRVLKLRDQFPELELLIQLDSGKAAPEGVRTLVEVEALGRERLESGVAEVDARTEAIQPEDLFTLIYTSGTTGKPKGVMLTHANIMSQIDCVPIQLSCTDRVLSILPIWHIFERMFEVFAISHGACTYYTDARHLGDDLKQVEPTFMGSAPRLWESLRHRILNKVRTSHPVRRGLFHIALFLGTHYREALFVLRDQNLRVKPVSPVLVGLNKIRAAVQWALLLPWYGFFNAAVLEAVRQKAGGSLKGTISGGGALPPEIDRFFNAIGIPVLEGYGLSETSPVVAVRTPERLVRGSVGPLIDQTEVRIVDLESGKVLYPDPEHRHQGRGLKGEIQVRGPQIMKGYFKDAEATAAVLDDQGWFRTGDLGMMTFNDTLKILGRSKATIVLRNGENVEPEPIEMKLKLCPLIEECVVVGQDAKHICALVLPDLEGCREAGFAAESLEELLRHSELRDHILSEIRNAMRDPSEFKRYEVVQDIRFLERPLEVGVELTNLFKLKRHVIAERYAELIGDMVEERHV